MGRFFIIILLLLLVFSFTGVQREEKDIDFRNPPKTSLALDLFSFWLPSNGTGENTSLFPEQNQSQNQISNSSIASNTIQGPGIREVLPSDDNDAQPDVFNGTESLLEPVISNNMTAMAESLFINSTTNSTINLSTNASENLSLALSAENSTHQDNLVSSDIVEPLNNFTSQYILPNAFGAEEISLELIDLEKDEAGITFEFNLINNVPKQRKGSIDFFIVEEGKEPSPASQVEAGFNFRYQVGKKYTLPFHSEEQGQAILNNTASFAIMVELFEDDHLISRVFVPFEEKE